MCCRCCSCCCWWFLIRRCFVWWWRRRWSILDRWRGRNSFCCHRAWFRWWKRRLFDNLLFGWLRLVGRRWWWRRSVPLTSLKRRWSCSSRLRFFHRLRSMDMLRWWWWRHDLSSFDRGWWWTKSIWWWSRFASTTKRCWLLLLLVLSLCLSSSHRLSTCYFSFLHYWYIGNSKWNWFLILQFLRRLCNQTFEVLNLFMRTLRTQQQIVSQ